MTLFVPALLGSLYAVISYVAKDKDQTLHMVNVIDNTGEFINKFQDEKYVKFRYSNRPLDVEKKDLKNDNDLVLNISANKKDNVELFSRKKTTLTLSDDIQRQMNDIAAGSSLVKAGIDTARLHKIKSNITIRASELTATGEQNANLGPAYALSFAGAILIYMSLFIYGAQVMRGVIEEKTNRIVEIIVSSVKPFQLMAGKIIDVSLGNQQVKDVGTEVHHGEAFIHASKINNP
jgi:ABC-2 type transport system permease protein